MDFEFLSLQLHGRHRPGMQTPDMVMDLLRGLTPINGAHGFIQHGRKAYIIGILLAAAGSSLLYAAKNLA